MKALTYELALSLFRDRAAYFLTFHIPLDEAIDKARAKLSPFIKPNHLDMAEANTREYPPFPLGA
jgi:hypothetical protein